MGRAIAAWSRVNAWTVITIVVIAAAAVAQLAEVAPVRRLQHALFDGYQALMPRERKSAPATIIVVDEDSLQAIGQWPWPRCVLARLFEKLAGMQPAAIAVDVVFPEPDRNSPEQVAASFADSLDSRTAALLRQLPRCDEQLAAAFGAGPTVIGISGDFHPGPQPPIPSASRVRMSGDVDGIVRFPGRIQSLPEFNGAAKGVALLNLHGDISDGVIRKVQMIGLLGTQPVLGMSAEALRVAVHAAPGVSSSRRGLALSIGDWRFDLDPEGAAWVHFGRSSPGIYRRASDVLRGDIDPSMVKDKVVIFGVSGLGLVDYKLTPLREYVPGPEVHAQMIEQAFDGRALARPPWLRFIETAMTVIVGLVVLRLASVLRLWRMFGVFLGLVTIAAAAGLISFRQGVLADVATLTLAWTAAFGLALAGSLASARRAREKAVYMFSRFVNPHVVRELLRDESLARGGEERRITLLFTDIRNFTQMSERQTPAEIVAMLNAYFSRQVEIVFRHNGALDKFIGDAMMVFWGAPLDDPEHASNAVLCALDLVDEAMRFRETLKGVGVDFDIGVGIHTGTAVVGLIGSQQRREYTAIGPAVNIASRVEGLTKEAGQRVLVTRETAQSCSDPRLAFEAVGSYVVKGVDRPIEVLAPRRAAPAVPS